MRSIRSDGSRDIHDTESMPNAGTMSAARGPATARSSSVVCASRNVGTPVVASELLSTINAGRRTPL